MIAGEAVRDDLYRVTSMVEKPSAADAPSNLAIIGRYILTPDIFDLIRKTPPGKNGEIQITDALLQQAREGCVMAYRFKGRRFDCGSQIGYLQATVTFGLAREEFRDEFMEFLQTVEGVTPAAAPQRAVAGR